MKKRGKKKGVMNPTLEARKHMEKRKENSSGGNEQLGETGIQGRERRKNLSREREREEGRCGKAKPASCQLGTTAELEQARVVRPTSGMKCGPEMAGKRNDLGR